MTLLEKIIRIFAKNSSIAEALASARERKSPPSICFVSATMLTKEAFWRDSHLGKSLKDLLDQGHVRCEIFYENRKGLPAVYNQAIETRDEDILVFLHDDVWLWDELIIEKITHATRKFDCVGVAGNTKNLKFVTWFSDKMNEQGHFYFKNDSTSGFISHGDFEDHHISPFGPTPAACYVLDGVFIAARRSPLIKRHVRFDTQFNFHFYDLDFCLSARKSGVSVGTWPIDLIHKSHGNFHSDSWRQAFQVFQKKWH